ncbi:MAG: hypothetical protein AAF591_15345 [Verrucomicrobiota bacterium]
MEQDGIFGISVVIVFVIIGLVGFGLWLWSLIHCVTNKRLKDTNRIIGVVLIVVLGLLGSLIYLFLPREDGVEGESGPLVGG